MFMQPSAYDIIFIFHLLYVFVTCRLKYFSLLPVFVNRAGTSPVLSTCPLHTNSGCGKERRILVGPGFGGIIGCRDKTMAYFVLCIALRLFLFVVCTIRCFC